MGDLDVQAFGPSSAAVWGLAPAKFLLSEECDFCLVPGTITSRVREDAGLLSPERIVEIRKNLGLSQTELEGLFGRGEKVVTRWENGRVVQGRTADVALRLLEMEPGVLPKLRKALSRSRHPKVCV